VLIYAFLHERMSGNPLLRCGCSAPVHSLSLLSAAVLLWLTDRVTLASYLSVCHLSHAGVLCHAGNCKDCTVAMHGCEVTTGTFLPISDALNAMAMAVFCNLSEDGRVTYHGCARYEHGPCDQVPVRFCVKAPGQQRSHRKAGERHVAATVLAHLSVEPARTVRSLPNA
jgi:hypothetical protein